MRHHLAPLFIAVSCLSVMITGCTMGDVDGETISRTTLRQPSPTLAQQPPAPAPVPDSNATGLPSDLAAALESIVIDTQNELGGVVGIAIAGPEGVVTAGTQAGVPAWSTIKVPISIAALRANPGNDVLMRQAITVSDNDAARALWDSLGSPREKVGAVLAQGGDPQTQVNDQPVRPEFSVFGQTQWALGPQAMFARHMGCVAGSGPVLDAMSEIVSSQRYGLGSIPGARFKGGWGPNLSGSYDVRQFGLVPISGVIVPVAVTAQASDGAYESGQQLLTRMATKLASFNGSVPSAECV
ncbi:hypothetical protein [Corynebacterium diphtheriae]|uniref:hypothetical protein n=1 Tax=Corynebacterium diphtheriae TaxID=1717 RepID=UPI0013CA1750|nr:hypothetical protein [Corynebacterium diphtheriae]CAB0742064.1 hypothetical protein FRC0135_00696 [Corynebacterium diphtheriae]